MAVEIPVYVDIDGAFNRAIKEIPKEMPKLEKVLSRYALNMKIDMGGWDQSIRNLLTDTTMDAKELERALRRVRKAYEDAVAKGASKTKTSANVNNLAKAYGLLSQRLNGFYDANAVAAMRLEDTIAKIQYKITGLRAQISTAAPGTDLFNKLNYDLKIQEKRLADVTRQQILYKSGIDASNTSIIKQSGLVRQLSGYFSALYAATSVVRFVKQVRDVTGELEYQRVALGHLLNDMEFGNELFEKTIEAAKESPFRITQLVTYTKQLAAYRIEQENLFDTTQRLADISAGLGVDMNRLILAYGQVRAASVLRGQELRQFTEAGIPLVELLAKKFRELGREGTSTADVFKLISERAVPFEYIKEIFEELTDAGGMFYKMQEEQAKTLKGRWEKLKDAYDQALNSLGSNDTFQNWNDKVLKILNFVAKNLNGIIKTLNAVSVGWVTYKVVTSNAAKATVGFTRAGVGAVVQLVKILGAADAAKYAVLKLGDAWKKIMVILKRNGVGLAFTVISTLLTYFTTFKKKADEASEPLTKMEKAIEDMKSANKQLALEKGLIDDYESLSKNTSRSRTESEHLRTVMEELKRLYPDLSSKIGDENTALDENARLLRKAADAKHNLSVEEAKNQLKNQEDIIRGLKDERDAAKTTLDLANRKAEQARLREQAGPVPMEQRYGPGTYETAQDLKDATIEAAKAAKTAQEEYDKIAVSLAEAENEAQKLRDLIYPPKKSPEMQAWAKEIDILQNSMKEVGRGVIFTLEDLKGFTSVYDLSKKLKKQLDDLATSIKGMKSEYENMPAEKKASEAGAALAGEIENAEYLYKMAEAIRVLLGLDFKRTTKTAYVQDPFIKQMQERIRFMKDFKRGYDDLNKYMEDASALGKESGIMESRGMALGLSLAEQQRAAKGLADWFKEAREKAWEQAKAHGATGTIESFLRQEIKDTSNRGKALKDFQQLMQSLFDAETDLKTDEAKKNLEKALKKLKDDIKRSEEAENFFNDILKTTGDEELAQNLTVSVYGDPGAELGERIKDEIEGALKALKIATDSGIGKTLMDAAGAMDFSSVMKDINSLPDELQEAVRRADAAIRKSNEETAKSYAKLLMQFDEINQKQVDIQNKAAKERADIEAGLQLELKALREKGATDAEQQAAKDRAELAQGAVDRDAKLQLSRLAADYRIFFSSVGVISEKAARKIAEAQKVALTDQFVRGEISLAKYKRELKELDEQLQKYKGWDMLENFLSGKWGTVLSEQLSNYSDGLLALASTLETKNGFWSPNESTKKFLKDIDRVLNFGNFAAIFKKGAKISIEDQANAAAKKAYNDAKLRGKSERMANKAAEEAAGEALAKAAEKAQKAQAILMDMTNAFAIIVKMFGSFSSMIEEYEDDLARSTADYSGALKTVQINGEDTGLSQREFLSAMQSLETAWDKIKNMDLFGGMRELYLGFSGINAQVKTANEDIQIQSRRIKDLEYAYNRLGVALEESFGSDYIANYNQQLVVLRAQAEAYRAQAEAERSKGKKADEETARGYEDSAKEVEDTIKDMMDQVSEFMSGTNLTSAAQEFAEAWIEAYKEFGSTTDAMKEKFNDMIENMVVNSLAARLIQSILQPVFKAIDDASEDGALTAEDVAAISKMVPERIAMINGSMSTLMNQLTAAGLNLRQMAGGFTGISRDIAGASEESINGLAAGINTQNFYMQHIDMNVTAILAALTGGTTTAQSGTTGEYVDPYKDSMLRYAGSLDEKLGLLLDAFNSVVTLNGTKRAIQVNM